MTKAEAKRNLISALPVGSYDYWTLQSVWAGYVDSLYKSNLITQKQYETWTSPWQYGRRVVITSEKKARYV